MAFEIQVFNLKPSCHEADRLALELSKAIQHRERQAPVRDIVPIALGPLYAAA